MASIVTAYQWGTPDEYYITLNPSRDEVTLHHWIAGKSIDQVGSVQDLESVQCYSYSPVERGLIGVGQSNGTVLVSNLQTGGSASPLKLSPRHSRPCNSLSFNHAGHVAAGLDKVRNENCLLVWDLAKSDENEKSILFSALSNEAVSSVEFLPFNSNLLLCSSYKFIREFDTRSSMATFQCATKYTYGVKVNPKDQNYFISYSDDGTMAIWDRRYMSSAMSVAEPALLMPRFNDQSRRNLCVRYAPSRSFELAMIQEGSLLRRWQIGVSSFPKKRTKARMDAATSLESLFVSVVIDCKTDHDKVVSFDYTKSAVNPALDEFVCIRASGQIFRMKITESPDAVRFDPLNDVIIAEPGLITMIDGKKGQHEEHREEKDDEDEDEEDEEDEVGVNGILNITTVLSGDISSVIRKRALEGYAFDCEKNVSILESDKSSYSYGYLIRAWKWLALATKSYEKGTMITSSLDLGYEGVWGVWEGLAGLDKKRILTPSNDLERDYGESMKTIMSRLKKSIFISNSLPSSEKEAQRQLCLRVAGWNFELSELESKLVELEEKGKYEQAAGWAVFHGDVERAIRSLSKSRNERLNLIATSVSGYLAYKDSTSNSPWRDHCRRLASELDNPYLRAIFAFISDGSWLDALDEGSLPLAERLGIALRFLPDSELTVYLNRLTERAIANGDLEGIVLTGLTPRVADLLQSYVDKTCDVQTASLISSFGDPRYFVDKRTINWVDHYRYLLNSWKSFSTRAKFDVGRTRISTRANGTITITPPPRQIYLRCSNCKSPITHNKNERSSYPKAITKKGNDPVTRCQNCNHQLPRCAICLLPMGAQIETTFQGEKDSNIRLETQFDRWFTICQSCNHGMHAGHARAWFVKYDVCPVPDCSCNCNEK